MESCCFIWGSNDIEWVENGACNNAVGIITMWRRNHFQLSFSFNEKNFSVIEEVWKEGFVVQITIVNDYSSGSLKEKKLIWEEISVIRRNHTNRVWCVSGDFNSIWCQEEGRSGFSV